MTRNSFAGIDRENLAEGKSCHFFRLQLMTLAVLWCSVLLAVTGCETQTPPKGYIESTATNHSEAITLRGGDVLKISFPSAPTLNTTQPIRRDGQISLPLIGEVKAAGMTPAELEKKLIELYASQLVSKEVTVTIESSSFPVFVTGMVIRPGKISSDHPITVLEAIMEAGGPDYTKANLKAVRVIRQEGSVVKNYTLNLKLALQGKQSEPFYLKPSDIVYVPERFTWF